MKISEIVAVARERPLVVLFCWERYSLFKMVLPRIVNATRRIGGYLWVVDDASKDERIPWVLERYLREGYVDRVFFGKTSRFIDWSPGHGGWGTACARRSVIHHFLTRRKAPLVIFCDPDMILAPDALEAMLTATRVAREANLPVSSYSGFRYNKTIFQKPEQNIAGFAYRLHGPYISMALSLLTLDTSRRLDREFPNKSAGRWSLNVYAVWANDAAGLQACYLMDVKSQHIGIGMVGRSWTDIQTMEVFAFNEDGTPLQIPGFDLDGFLEISNSSCTKIQTWAYKDKVDIEEPRGVHPEFLRLKEIIGEN